MRAMIVRFDFGADGAGDMAEWRRYVTEESVPRFEAMAGLRHKLFLWGDEPPRAVAVYLFSDDAVFRAYAEPLLADPGRFTTTGRFGAPATIEILDVAGVADGPEAPDRS